MTISQAILNLDFANTNGLVDPRIAFSRAAVATFVGQNGLLQTAFAGVPRVPFDPVSGSCLGLMIEEQRINEALYCRDASNAAWTKTNITAAKDQTGIDGSATSASSLLATATNGTCTQAITSSSNTRTFSVYVKRLVGTGIVYMTLDNSTFTDVTSQITGAGPNGYARISVSQAALTNPTIGFKLAVNADKIAVDYVQEEVGAFATSAVLTTAATFTRVAETSTMLLSAVPGWNANAGTIVLKGIAPPTSAVAGVAFQIDDGTENNRLTIRRNASGVAYATVVSGSVTIADMSLGAWAAGTLASVALSWKAGAFNAVLNGGTVSNVATGAVPLSLATARLGANSAAVSWDGQVYRVVLFPQAATAADIQSLTL